MHRFLLLFSLVWLSSCIESPIVESQSFEGLKPIYISEEENVVEVQEARGFENLGKIVYAAPYLLINERFKGIHVVDNTDPSNPIKLSFIQIPGNTDFTLKDQYLYANHGSDLKTFLLGADASNLGLAYFNFEETQLIPDFFGESGENSIVSLFPPNYTGFFECVDPDAGIVIGWDTAILSNPECRI